jgi:hypothetical protein
MSSDPNPPLGEPKMKRPQFSLRVMLLVVTFVAACLGWRAAVVNEDRSDRLSRLQLMLSSLESEQAHFEYRLQNEADPSMQTGLSLVLKSTKSRIVSTKKMLDELSD